MQELQVLKKLAALILVRMPYVGNETDFAAMVRASVKDVTREIRRKQREEREAAEERLLWQIDKSLSPKPIQKVLTELGF